MKIRKFVVPVAWMLLGGLLGVGVVHGIDEYNRITRLSRNARSLDEHHARLEASLHNPSVNPEALRALRKMAYESMLKGGPYTPEAMREMQRPLVEFF